MLNRSKIAYAVGLGLLFHAVYSSYEFHQLLQSNNKTFDGLPVDIIIETLFGVVVVIVGAIISIENSQFYTVRNELKTPTTKYLKSIEMKDNINYLETFGVKNYEQLNSRLDFIDILKKRKEYSSWANNQ